MDNDVERIGSYELRGELGRGAMAKVWRAWDPQLEREVAIKEPLFDPRLPSEVLAEMGRRFVKEGRTAAKLNHPNIVTIYAADVYDGRPAIIMELVDGITLADLLDQGRLSPQETLGILDQLLDAIGYAHDHDVVHRDIKPENIFVNSDGLVKLADFGIAHVDDDSATRATVFGSVLGTPGYMSPEQAIGAQVDARSDLFSVGIVAYEMLAGSNPFGAGDSTTLLYRIVHEPAPELPDHVATSIPQDMRPAIMKALSKDPADRPQNAAAFKAMLHGGASSETDVMGLERSIPNNGAGKGDMSQLTSNRAFPYAIVGLVGVAILLVVFFSATSGNMGGAVGSSTSAGAVLSDAGDDTPDETAEEGSEEPTTSADATDTAANNEPIIRASLSAYSWGELSVISAKMQQAGSRSAALAVGEKYHLCDAAGYFMPETKHVQLTDGSELSLRLVDIMHDSKSDGSGMASMSFLGTTISHSRRMAPGTRTDGGWQASELRQWMNGELLGKLPSDLSGAVVAVEKQSNNIGKTTSLSCVTSTSDYLWAPSIVELCGPVNWEYSSDPGNSSFYNAVFNAEGSQYAYYAQQSIRIEDSNACLSLGGDWWMRSTAASSGRGRHVKANGDPSAFGDSSETLGVVVGLCI